MKKGLLLVVVMLATIAVKAQDIYVGGSLNVWRNSTRKDTSICCIAEKISILSRVSNRYSDTALPNEAPDLYWCITVSCSIGRRYVLKRK